MANIILNLPFDEQNGATIAYDYSASRADGTVHDAYFVKGRNGNAIHFDGNGHVDVAGNDMQFDFATRNFSMLAAINVGEIEVGTPKLLCFVFKFDGDSLEDYRLAVNAGSWLNIAIVRDVNRYSIYLNAQVVYSFENESELKGMGINQDVYVPYGLGSLDDVKIYDDALTQSEIIDALSTLKQPSYYIDGINIKEAFGVCVSGSEGLLNRPKLKNPIIVSREREHGEQVYIDRKFVEPREITLNCFIKANSRNEFIQRVVDFERLFDRRGGASFAGGGYIAGTNRLHVDVHPVKPLMYEVYMKDSIEVSKTWNDSLMVGTFKLKLVEPCPVKRVLKQYVSGDDNKQVSVTLCVSSYVNIYWGDGTVDYDVTTEGDNTLTLTHTYSTIGEYFIIIVGEIEDITQFSTNAIIVWNRL
jgi:hypothetical protein